MPMGRRTVLTAASLLLARTAHAARPAAAELTPALIEAAKKEGKVTWYTSNDLVLATAMAKGFEAKYGMTVQLERTGAERVYQRLAQEYASGLSEADVATTSDMGHTVAWLESGWLASYVPAETGHWPDEAIGPDGTFMMAQFSLVIPGYNSRLVKAEDAPKTWNDLLDPKWKGKMVKAHPGYSGAISTETYALSHLLGWEFYEKLAKQGVMQVQSATDPPMRAAQGERAIMADCSEGTALRLISEGAPLGLVYPPEGVPLVGIGSVVLTKSTRPSAARLYFHWLASSECQAISLKHGVRGFDTTLTDPPGWVPLSKIKLLYSDPVAMARESEEIKKRYTKTFGI